MALLQRRLFSGTKWIHPPTRPLLSQSASANISATLAGGMSLPVKASDSTWSDQSMPERKTAPATRGHKKINEISTPRALAIWISSTNSSLSPGVQYSRYFKEGPCHGHSRIIRNNEQRRFLPNTPFGVKSKAGDEQQLQERAGRANTRSFFGSHGTVITTAFAGAHLA